MIRPVRTTPIQALTVVIVSLVLSGCAMRGPVPSSTPAPLAVTVPSHKPRTLIVFIPQTDDAAQQWLALFTKYPNLRMVIAMSPRFLHFAKDPTLRLHVQELEKAKRLELAMQLPNAPLLPLLVDSQSAKDALLAETPLPRPPFAYPDDVIQLVARAKADYFKTWRTLPHGLTLPYGAASEKVFDLFDRLGFSWMCAALSAPPADGPYKAGSFVVWDSTPMASHPGTLVQVWDERTMKDPGGSMRVLKAWIQTVETQGRDFLLPSDPGVQSTPLPPTQQWSRRSWVGKDWSTWIGRAKKNAAWDALRRTRQALEGYKNSGRAVISRLDAAFEEIFTAENATYFAAIGNESLASNVSEDREHEFQATLGSVYRLIGQAPAEDLFSSSNATPSSPATAGTGVQVEPSPAGTDHISISDPSGDDRGDGKLSVPPGVASGSLDIRRIDVEASSETVTWKLAFEAPVLRLGGTGVLGPMVDIYIDLNGQPYAGTPSFFAGRRASPSPKEAWEYAMVVDQAGARLFRTQGGNFELAGTFPVQVLGNAAQWSIPRSAMRGNPRRWGYQVFAIPRDAAAPAEGPAPLVTGLDAQTPPIYDLLDPQDVPQMEVLQDVAAGKRNDIPFLRLNTQ